MKQIKVSIKQILVKPERGRKIFGRIEELAASIKTHGFINPILCTESTIRPGFYDLVAGERRYRGAVLAGLVEIPITFREGLSEIDQKVIELEENVCRQDLTWDEEALLHLQIHELKKSQNPNWEQRQTAELVQLSKSHVGDQIAIAKKLRDDPKLREEVKHLPMAAAFKVIANREQVQRADRLQSQGKLQITTDLRLGDCRDLIKAIPSASIDLLLTDPPYGLEQLELLRKPGGKEMTGHQLMGEDHNSNIADVLTMLRTLAPEFARVLKPGAHFYCFAAFQYVGDFIAALSPLVFQPPMVVWDRAKPTTPGYGYNYLNSLEAIIYGYNPPAASRRRLAKNMYNRIEHPEVPRNLRVYPTEKPQALLKDLILQSSITGEVVLDPFAGSASTLKAARALGRKSIGFEKNPDSWKRAQLHLSGAVAETEGSLLADEQPAAKANSANFSVGAP